MSDMIASGLKLTSAAHVKPGSGELDRVGSFCPSARASSRLPQSANPVKSASVKRFSPPWLTLPSLIRHKLTALAILRAERTLLLVLGC